MDRSPWFLRQMAYKFLHSICPYSPHNNLRLRREVAFTRAHPTDCPVRTCRLSGKNVKPAGSAPWLALKCSAWSPSRHCNFSSSRRYINRSPWFLRQMAYNFLHSICPYSPHNNLRLRREVAFTRAHPVDCPVRTSRRLSKSRIEG